jgi:hypothetical protein
VSEPVPPNPVLDEAIKRAVIAGNFEAAVDCCVKFGRMADAMLLAATGGRELFQKTQERYFELMKHQSFMKITVGGHVHVHVRVHVLVHVHVLVLVHVLVHVLVLVHVHVHVLVLALVPVCLFAFVYEIVHLRTYIRDWLRCR